MLDKDISHTFTDSVKKKLIELGFPKTTSGHLSKIILPYKIDTIEQKVVSRCDNFFYLEQIIKPYQDEIHDIVKKCWGENFIFEIDNNSFFQSQKENKIKAEPEHVVAKKEVISHKNEEDNLPQRVSFKNFIELESNYDALKACLHIVKNCEKSFAPLFVYSQTGLGKSHLLQAIGSEISKKNKSFRIVYLCSQEFVNEVIQKGIRLGKMDEVRNKYKQCDVLLVDDIQILEKKAVCQSEFLNILTSVLKSKKQVIMTSQKPPKDFKFMDGRLKSRLLQSVILEMQLPTFEDMKKIFQFKSKELSLNLTQAQIELMSSVLQINIREINGLLHDLMFKSQMIESRKTVQERIAQTIQERVQNFKHVKTHSLIQLQKNVCTYFNIENSDLKSNSREKNIAFARHLSIFIAKKVLKLRTSEIVEGYGRKHHKLVSYSTDKINQLLKTDIETRMHLDALTKKVSL